VHPRQASKLRGLVHTAGSPRPAIDLLQRDEVRLCVTDDLRQSFQIERAILALPMVDVVGHHANADWRRGLAAPRAGCAETPRQCGQRQCRKTSAAGRL